MVTNTLSLISYNYNITLVISDNIISVWSITCNSIMTMCTILCYSIHDISVVSEHEI